LRLLVAHDETKKIHQEDYLSEACNIGAIPPGAIELVSSVQEARLAWLHELGFEDCASCSGPT